MKDIFSQKLNPAEFDPFSGNDIYRVIPLTESQVEIWLSSVLGGDQGNSAYNESISMKFHGTLDVTAFDKSLCVLVRRHESLRSSFSKDGKHMLVYENIPDQLIYKDIAHQSFQEKADFLKVHLLSDAMHVFNLVEGPLFKATLIKTGENDHHFTFTAHHLIIDGWSIGVVLQELGKIYSAFVKESPHDLPPPKAFSDFAQEQNVFIGSKQYQEIEEYWLKLYKDKVPVLNLPTDHPRPTSKTYKSSRLDFILEEDLINSLKKTAKEANCTFVNTLMTSFEVFLYRVTGQEDIILGLPASGQSFQGYYDLVGHCVNLLPLRSKPQGKMGFIDYLSERKLTVYDAFENQQITFGSLLKKLKISRDPSRIPLVPVIFNVDFGITDGVDFHDLTFDLISNDKEFLNFEWFLNVNGSEKSVVLEWSYNSQLFEPDTMHKMMNDFNSLLHQIVNDPNIKIKDISLPSNNILEKLGEWNRTKKDFPKDTPFTKIIHDIAVHNSDKVAIEFHDHKTTYKELDEQSNQLAAYLINKGLQREDIVAVSLDRTPEMVVVLLGIVKAGAAYLPLDPEYPKERIEFMLKDSKAKLLITSRNLSGNFIGLTEQAVIEDIWLNIKFHPTQYPEVGLDGKSLAYILYTSGSTGNPKGVQIEHHSLLNFLLSMQAAPGINPGDRLLAITTISFDIAGLELFLPLITGATVILADTKTARDGRLLLKWLEEKKTSVMQATPSTWRMLLNAGWEKSLSLKALSGGEALPKDLADKLLERCDAVWNVYGPTETTIWSTIKELDKNEEELTIGRPIDNTQIYLLDEDQSTVPLGNVGEIYIGGEGVARGYLNRENLTSQRFFDDPFTLLPGQGAKMYRTGDLGKFLQNGEIVCLGRVDHQVKIRGFRIEVGEIEQRLHNIPGINEAVVIARDDKTGNKRLAAYVLLEKQFEIPGTSPTKEQVTAWKKELGKILPVYMIPNEWVVLKKFPLTSNNKVDRNSLPKPTESYDKGITTSNLPTTKIQKQLADIWQKSLGIKNINLEDDFFELGGHSLVAVEVMVQIEVKTGKLLPLNTIFEYPTLGAFAELLSDEKKSLNQNWASLVPIQPEGDKPPIYLIHAAGSHVSTYFPLAKKLDPDQPVYGVQAKGLNGIDQPLTTMEEIAAHYLSEIMEHNPNGPYYIGGHSFGGYVAYEMARQMRQMNKEVDKLILFDIYAYQSEVELKRWQKVQRRINEEIQKRYVDLKLLINAPQTLIGLKQSSMEKKKRKIMKFLNLEKKGIESERFHTIEKIRKINHKAMDDYLLSKYEGEIYLFKAQIQNFYAPDKAFYGWKSFVDKINIVEIEGDHNSMFKDPIVEVVGKKLQEILDN